jgi:hypothetical protein
VLAETKKKLNATHFIPEGERERERERKEIENTSGEDDDGSESGDINCGRL